jgi:hypothetical protein
MFISNYNRGFSMTFENGLTISVQFGTGNYCERRSYHEPFDGDLKTPTVQSPDAEIAIWDKSDVWFDFGSDAVKGRVSPDEVATWIARVQKAESIKDV